MKISRRQLRQIIREEYTRLKVRKMINEAGYFDEKYSSDGSQPIAYIRPTQSNHNCVVIQDGDRTIEFNELQAAEPNLCKHIYGRCYDYRARLQGKFGAAGGTADIDQDLEEMVKDLCNRVLGKPCRIVFQ